MTLEIQRRAARIRSTLSIGCIALSLHVLSGCAAQPLEEPETDDKAAAILPGIAVFGALLVTTGVLVWSQQRNRFEADEGWREVDWMAELLTDLVAWAVADGDTRAPEEIVLNTDAADWPSAHPYRSQAAQDLGREQLDETLEHARQAAEAAFGRGSPDGATDTCYIALAMGKVADNDVNFYARSATKPRAKAVAEAMCHGSPSFVQKPTNCLAMAMSADAQPCLDAAWITVNMSGNKFVFHQ